MIITKADLFYLRIPFKLGFSHSKADRFFSDSIILRTESETGDGRKITGYGEAVIREYVSGRPGGSAPDENPVVPVFTGLLKPFTERDLDTPAVLSLLEAADPPATDLPLLCAVENAVLDTLCRIENTDIYRLIGRKPLRESVVYSGTLPLMPEQAAEKLLGGYRQMKIPSLRIKIGRETDYNRAVIGLARRIMGSDYDLKVDANAGWSLADAAANIPLLVDAGISIIEEPFGREEAGGDSLIRQAVSEYGPSGIVFMADESALNISDLQKAAEYGTYGMVNIRLAKNGGLLKALALAEEAERLGLRYMAGCHVGETGILSAAGRTASTLMKNPEYTDGSYDSHLLSGNITSDDLSFGPGGRASIIRNRALGFEIDENKLQEYTNERISCF